ncbi:FAD/NAD(P)-binding domain-containing protein [Rhizodiscina lignyota]|uniref:FAD/NAD(P)-binding domain-containing protein n=1 Tax=Rhizodiscina lignyota TaxID=1504668 RepID=A0A9P4IFT0_9PEZI|nr:FAD/NAD(P)-binding domain-containing protein [Rhizodiscina lignyota]
MEKRPWPQVENKDFGDAAVVIIGAGIAGMCTAIDLIRKNNCRNFIILERGSGIGGTWNDNRYPGCCCDVPSIMYSFSFEQNPNWSRKYPGQEEILNHLHAIAEKWGLYRHTRFNSAATDARWDDEEMKWKTTVKICGDKDSEYSSGYTITSDFLVSAVGQLNEPKMPSIPGLDSFKGKIMHTARWDWSYDLEGKRIAVIGNGATGIQVVPELVKVASHVTQYIRTPGWIIPRLDTSVSTLQRLAYQYSPPLLWRHRAEIFTWMDNTFKKVVWNPENPESKMARQWNRALLQATWPKDEELWEKLTPDYPPGCKRILFSDDYYPALTKPNCSLEMRPISRITESGIEVEGGDVEEFDLIVCATGFHAGAYFVRAIDVQGEGGRPISDIWRHYPQALYGISLESLPNFGMLYGPNTNLNHSSIILMIEAQSNYISGLVEEVLYAKKLGLPLAITPKKDRLEEFNEMVQEKLKETSYSHPTCNSWYKSPDGKRVVANWCGSVVEYQTQLSKIAWSDYDVKGAAAEVVLKGKKEKKIGRVVEETMVSNMALATGVLGAVAVVGGCLLHANGYLRRFQRR